MKVAIAHYAFLKTSNRQRFIARYTIVLDRGLLYFAHLEKKKKGKPPKNFHIYTHAPLATRYSNYRRYAAVLRAAIHLFHSMLTLWEDDTGDIIVPIVKDALYRRYAQLRKKLPEAEKKKALRKVLMRFVRRSWTLARRKRLEKGLLLPREYKERMKELYEKQLVPAIRKTVDAYYDDIEKVDSFEALIKKLIDMKNLAIVLAEVAE